MEGCFLWLSEPWPLPWGFWEWSPRAPPLERVQSGAGVVWLLWGFQEMNRFSRGFKEPCVVGNPNDLRPGAQVACSKHQGLHPW